MRKQILLLILTTFLASCSGISGSIATDIPPAETPAPLHAPEIRFGLVGAPTQSNPWMLFDEAGAAYNDYALRSDYYPRLYRLSPVDFGIRESAAEGFPSAFQLEGEAFVSTVNLRKDLKWTDGSPFTAFDIAFTVNTALAFELNYDWNAWYRGSHLLRAEAAGDHAVKFYFKQKPNVEVWQYGAMQGVVLQEKYWAPKIQNAEGLLPEEESRAQIDAARATVNQVQLRVNDLAAQIMFARATGAQDPGLDGLLEDRSNELIYAQNKLDKLLEEYQFKIDAAQADLFEVNSKNEPVLGVWMFLKYEKDEWVNAVNPDFPFEQPNFDRAVYVFYKNEKAALAAFKEGEINAVLTPRGVSAEIAEVEYRPSMKARFMVFNTANTYLADPVLRMALGCVIDRIELTSNVLEGKAFPLDTFALGMWKNGSADICAGLDESARIARAVDLLKARGYSWEREPGAGVEGRGLNIPGTGVLPEMSLLLPVENEDPLKYQTGVYFAGQAQKLGIKVTLKQRDSVRLTYDVFSSRDFDIALTGWRLGAYPSQLCSWFGSGGQFDYGNASIQAQCGALSAEPDIETAMKLSFEIQTSLANEAPFVPLYLESAAEAVRGIRYPFDAPVGDWYGAPALAFPK